MTNKDQTQQFQQVVKQAIADKHVLRICGSDSKSFYGNESRDERSVTALATVQHSGIIAYEPSELFITVRAGTPLTEIEQTLASENQMLSFEPPHFGDRATIGGTLACGFSGPRRPFAGAARDAVLGCTIINGKGEVLHFGGQVMKNVAGYDVTRLMVGALGTLGVLLDVTLKVLPKPEVELNLVHGLGIQEALDVMCARACKPLPLSAASYDGEAMVLRLSGTEAAVTAARKKISGDDLESGAEYWQSVREQTHYFFQAYDRPLWRISLAPGILPLALPGQWLFDWGGALRWLSCDMPIDDVQGAVAAEGGHATLFRGKEYFTGDNTECPVDVFQPLPAPLLAIHQRLKQAFDPDHIFNRGRFHADID